MSEKIISESNTSSGAVNVKTEFVETHGRKIAYRSIGKGLPIIMVNRFRGNLDTWDPAFLDSLASNFHVITIDYSGIGLSTGNTTGVLSMAKDAKDVAEALNLKNIIIAGWSVGGMVAQTVMAQYPELVSHAILIGTTPPGKNKVESEKIFWDTALKPVNDFDDWCILFFEPKSESSKNEAKLSYDRISKRTKDLDIPVLKEFWGVEQKAFNDFFEDSYDTLGKIKTSKIPILVIMGDHDAACNIENWFAMIGKLPSTQLIVMPQAGHAPHQQYPEIVAKYITSFIQNST